MRIGIDISPLNSGHKVRGVGSYVRLIRDNIEKYDKANEYVFFENQPPPELDVVHYPYFDPFSLLPRFEKNVKIIITVHDLIPVVYKKNFPSGLRARLRWEINRLKIKRSDLIIVDSKASKMDLLRITGISESKVTVSYLAANPIYRNDRVDLPSLKKYNLPNEYLLYVGDATWNKNIPRLVESVKDLDISIVMVGKVWEKDEEDIVNNPWNKDLKKSLKIMKNDEHFIRLGFVSDDDLVNIYRNALCLVMPSIAEGFGLPVLEAMASGCPVVTSNKSSLPEVGGNAVLYVDPESTSSIKKGIIKIKSEKKLRAELIEKGLRRASEFSIKKMMEDLIDSYDLVLRN